MKLRKIEFAWIFTLPAASPDPELASAIDRLAGAARAAAAMADGAMFDPTHLHDIAAAVEQINSTYRRALACGGRIPEDG